jgi:putative flippase GtrA
MKILTNPRERTRFLRFAVVGTIGAAVDFGVFNLFTSVFHVVPVVSSVISFIAAVTNN